MIQLSMAIGLHRTLALTCVGLGVELDVGPSGSTTILETKLNGCRATTPGSILASVLLGLKPN